MNTNPVYFAEEDEQRETPLETREITVTIRLQVKHVPVAKDAKEFGREVEVDVQKALDKYSLLAREYEVEPEVVDAERTTELESGEHTPTLEHILNYLAKNQDTDARKVAASAAGATGRQVYENFVFSR